MKPTPAFLVCVLAWSAMTCGADFKCTLYAPGVGATPSGTPIALGPGPHLFLDDTLIERSSNVARRVNVPRRDPAIPNPLVTGREDGCFQPYMTVVRDAQTGRFRLWYGVRTADANPGRSHVGYLESEDGIRWLRPHRVLPDPAPIQFGVSVLDEGPEHSDPARRFKFGWYHGTGLRVAGSPDGLEWKALTPEVVLRHSHDINGLFRDAIRKRYVATISSYTTGPTWSGQRRVTQHSASTDLQHWSEPWFVLTPEDKLDSGETQFYAMDGYLQRGDLCVGMVKVLRDDLKADSPPDPPDAYGIGYTTLAWSHDGERWIRDREPFFDRSPERGAWDHAHAWIDEQTPVGGEVHLYYGGYRRGHKVNRFEERQIGLVKMRRDRYVARESGSAGGTLTTPLVVLNAETLTLNADARAGAVRVQLLAPDGQPIPGFSKTDCEPVQGDALDAPVRWAKPLSVLGARPVRIEFSLTDARLFAFDLQRRAPDAQASPTAPPRANYARPFEPPTRRAFLPLPPGAIEPAGWLRDWCLAARDGYTGHMNQYDDEFKRAWAPDHTMTGEGLLWYKGAWPYEGGGYWFDGLARLGFALHDDALIQQARRRLDAVAQRMNTNGLLFLWWLDRNKPADRKAVAAALEGWPLWACGLLGRAMTGCYAGSGDPSIIEALEKAYGSDPECLRSVTGNLSNLWPAYDTYCWTGSPGVGAALDGMFKRDGGGLVPSLNRYRVAPELKPGTTVDNAHVVEFIESTTPWLVGYLWTGDERYLEAAVGWHDLIERIAMQPHGVPVSDEWYGPTGAFRGSETCDVAGYVWSQVCLLMVTGEGRMADRLERAFFNAGPATVSRDFKTHVYFQSPNRFANLSPDFPHGPRASGGAYQPKHSPLCCTAALNRIVPWFVTHMWMATCDNGLAAIGYGPCAVRALVADRVPVALACKTDYPFNDTIDVAVEPARESAFPLDFHIPAWCTAPALSVNGAAVAVAPNTRGFARVDRTWKPGDTVRLRLPMTARFERGRDAASSGPYDGAHRATRVTIPEANDTRGSPYASVAFGPLLFALPIPDTADSNTPDPAARWQVALDVQEPGFLVERAPMPARWDWPLDAPLRLQANVFDAEWNPDPKAPQLPVLPIPKAGPAKRVTLIPYGCTKFRISMFPVTAEPEVKPSAIRRVLFPGRDPANAARSERSFTHDGVAGHPGDRGMKALADAIVKAILQRGSPAGSPTVSGKATALDPFANLPCILEIDAAASPPSDEQPAGVSRVEPLLGQPARILPPGAEARRMVYTVGAGAGLVAGRLYLLEVEYPDDVPRAFFMANRGADLVRGWATGTAIGDARRQYVEPSVESLAYPLSGAWQRYRQFFVLHERFQGIHARRNPDPGCRPFTPTNGFHLVFFQTTALNDPRSQGMAIGRIRLYAVPDPERLVARPNRPPPDLPQRRVFWREEMADQTVSAQAAADRAFADPLDWFAAKLRIASLLGLDTFAKDLLEFGFNQGWEGGNAQWVMDAQPPLHNLWTRLVPLAAQRGFTLLPYYEYKGALGLAEATPPSLGWQRRAGKLYHGIHRTGDDPRTNRYTGVWWTEDHNADLTDPDTRADFARVLERTVGLFKGQAQFAGVWLRTRANHLPVSFSDATVARFREAFPGDARIQQASRPALIASYEADRALYDRYLEWWLEQRKGFLAWVQQELARALGGEPQVLFTPWTGEPVPELTRPDTYYTGVGVVTDDPSWWDTYAKGMTDDWYRWKCVPTAFDEVVAHGWWARTLSLRCPINDPGNWSHAESYHSAPGADPEHYRDVPGVMMTYPIGRLFAVAGPDPIARYRAQSGLTAVHHFPLNENDEGWDRMDANTRLAQPFQNLVGYVAVDVDRAGPLALLNAARAVAYGDPRNLAFLCASSFSTGFPAELRRFFLPFQAVPALPSRTIPNAASDADVVLREIPAGRHGTYYLLVNPTWHTKAPVTVRLPAKGEVQDLVEGGPTGAGPLTIRLEPAALRAWRVIKPL